MNCSAVVSVMKLIAPILGGDVPTEQYDWGCILHGIAGSGKTKSIREVRRLCEQYSMIDVFEINAGDIYLYELGELEYELLKFCKSKPQTGRTRVILADDIDTWSDFKSLESMLLSLLSESEKGKLFLVSSCVSLDRVPVRLIHSTDVFQLKVIELVLPGNEERATLLKDLLIYIPIDEPIDTIVDDVVALTQVYCDPLSTHSIYYI